MCVSHCRSPSSLDVGSTSPSVKQEELRSPEPAPPSANKSDMRAMARKQLTRILQARCVWGVGVLGGGWGVGVCVGGVGVGVCGGGGRVCQVRVRETCFSWGEPLAHRATILGASKCVWGGEVVCVCVH